MMSDKKGQHENWQRGQQPQKLRWRDYRPGPAMLVTAAFIGPGTVTTASLAGAANGFSLLWALIFAIFGAVILQNMAGRIGIVRKQGLAEALLLDIPTNVARWAMAALILAALVIGNAAYEGGNLGGAVAGAQILLPSGYGDKQYLIISIAVIAALLFLFGSQKLLTGILTLLVSLMSIAFVIAALAGGIDFGSAISGLVPSLPDGTTLTAIALIGTTIVPYNLFLHAALACDKWAADNNPHAVSVMQRDTMVAVSLGGVISIAILSTSATFIFAQSLTITNAADMAQQIAPVAGEWAKLTIGIGLFAAGLTSAITAPLATALIVQELFNVFRKSSEQATLRTSTPYKITGLAIIVIGAVMGFADISLLSLIVTAQIANGLLLPLVAILLYRLVFRRNNAEQSSLLQKIPAMVVIAVTLLLTARQLFLVVEKIGAS